MSFHGRLLAHPAVPWSVASICGCLLAWRECGLAPGLLGIPLFVFLGFGFWHGCSKWSLQSPARFFTVFAIGFGIFMVFAVPPGQIPDENAHYLKAYMTSCGILRVVQDGSLPVDISRDNSSVLKRTLPQKLPHVRTAVSGYSPIPYLASGAAVWICRMTGCSYLCSIYPGFP